MTSVLTRPDTVLTLHLTRTRHEMRGTYTRAMEQGDTIHNYYLILRYFNQPHLTLALDEMRGKFTRGMAEGAESVRVEPSTLNLKPSTLNPKP